MNIWGNDDAFGLWVVLWYNCLHSILQTCLNSAVSSGPEEDCGVVWVLYPILLLCLNWNLCQYSVTLFYQFLQLSFVQSLLDDSWILLSLKDLLAKGVCALIEPPESWLNREVDFQFPEDLLDLLQVHLACVGDDWQSSDTCGDLGWEAGVWCPLLSLSLSHGIAVNWQSHEAGAAYGGWSPCSTAQGSRASGDAPQHVVDVLVRSPALRRTKVIRNNSPYSGRGTILEFEFSCVLF